jgi:hypothetical protein|tara:strand:+ start:713 stop:958 length:246 start_codon:yes stop_codon:yes gene_type:complete
MEINLHDCTSIEMEQTEFNNFTVTTVTVTTEHQGQVEMKLFHKKEKNILFDFVDNFDMMTSKNIEGEVIQFKPCVAWREVV